MSDRDNFVRIAMAIIKREMLIQLELKLNQ